MERERKNGVLTAANGPEPAPMPALTSKLPPAVDFRLQRNMFYERITNIFTVIGIPAHIKGYHFLREAVALAAGNFDIIHCMTKKLYPLVAKRFNTGARTVERGIRNAIKITWDRGKMINLNTVFGIDIYEKYDKPSNGELIALLAEKIYLDCNNL